MSSSNDVEVRPDISSLPLSHLKLMGRMFGTIPGVSTMKRNDLLNELTHLIDSNTIRPFFRTIDGISKTSVPYFDIKTYMEIADATRSFNCHHGQRKLFFALFEFLILCAQRLSSLDDCMVVYIGAAPGYNIRIIADLFPSLHFLLIDPNKFDISPHPNITIWNMFFEDKTVDKVLEFCKPSRRRILFVSDIRLSPEEEAVFDDMMHQQSWAVRMRSQAMMLKFRPPYYSEDGALLNRVVIPSDIVDLVEKVPSHANKLTKKTVFPYLDGEVYLQLYAPPRSTETRLIVFNIQEKGESQPRPYPMRMWDYRDYEAKMNAFNIMYRSLVSYYIDDDPNSVHLGDHLLGYGRDYDSIAEYAITRQYAQLKHTGSMIFKTNDHNNADFAAIVRFLFDINMKFISHYGLKVSLGVCPIGTLQKQLSKQDNNADLGRDVVESFVTRMTKVISKRLSHQLRDIQSTVPRILRDDQIRHMHGWIASPLSDRASSSSIIPSHQRYHHGHRNDVRNKRR